MLDKCLKKDYSVAITENQITAMQRNLKTTESFRGSETGKTATRQYQEREKSARRKKMKKRWISVMMAAALAASMPAAAILAEEEGEATAVTTVGAEDGTHFEMWSFVDVHNEFYAKMVEQWNEENPDDKTEAEMTCGKNLIAIVK